ncbi:MmcQ/YjbR family DNA-binding protein [uncultured Algimonas sp.]|uniref:MmcQ/YjbR family DNA-binding protein n=1 Tax=uncultured Algimonas sp. TaxID=1547920 RepID=UPI00262A7DBF|nr:MmcQ/YjbR family DNA-binding protein [uncultured Algimonas sp.]
MMTDADIHMAATALPCVFMTEQWMGSHVYKIGDPETFKMFAILNPGKSQLTIKTPDRETANVLIEAGVAQRHTHMPRGSWVMLLPDRLERDDVEERLATSHSLCAASLTKAARKKFGLD